MAETRKKVSIYDYPEHLNPFSESHITTQRQRKAFNTWSSKISKRINRPVSWIEKSWLALDGSASKKAEDHEKNYLSKLPPRAVFAASASPYRNSSNSQLSEEPLDSRTEIGSKDSSFDTDSVKSDEGSVIRSGHIKRKKKPAPKPPISPSRSTPVLENDERLSSGNNSVKNEGCIKNSPFEEESDREFPPSTEERLVVDQSENTPKHQVLNAPSNEIGSEVPEFSCDKSDTCTNKKEDICRVEPELEDGDISGDVQIEKSDHVEVISDIQQRNSPVFTNSVENCEGSNSPFSVTRNLQDTSKCIKENTEDTNKNLVIEETKDVVTSSREIPSKVQESTCEVKGKYTDVLSTEGPDITESKNQVPGVKETANYSISK